MSREAVQTIIGKAVLDSDFREGLFASPDETLAGYELTEEELAALKAMDAETVASFAGSLDERISKAMAPGPAMGLRGGGLAHSWDPEYGWNLPGIEPG